MKPRKLQRIRYVYSLVVLPVALAGITRAQESKLAPTPPMGWNSCTFFGEQVTDTIAREEARAMATDGMKAAGYEYVNLDAGWEGLRNARGDMIQNPKFPDMKSLSDYIHSLGLKFGIYTTPGPWVCGGGYMEFGSYQHEVQDAKMFAAWGVDYLKYDYCSARLVYRPDQMQEVNRKMYEALRSTGRPIVFSLCQYGLQQVWRWGPAVGANLWRTTGDGTNNYTREAFIGFEQNGLEKYAGPGHWNDPDIMEIGNGVLSVDEEKMQMSLWSLLAAPLIAGNDLRAMTQETLGILTNREVIAVDQDPQGIQGRRIAEEGPLEVWMKPLSDGSKAVGLFNRETGDAKIEVNFHDIGIAGAGRVRDLWEHKDLGIYRGNFSSTVPMHGVVMIKVTPVDAKE